MKRWIDKASICIGVRGLLALLFHRGSSLYLSTCWKEMSRPIQKSSHIGTSPATNVGLERQLKESHLVVSVGRAPGETPAKKVGSSLQNGEVTQGSSHSPLHPTFLYI